MNINCPAFWVERTLTDQIMGAYSSGARADRTGLVSIAEENPDAIGAGGPPGI
jgi:hypothetical protein